jgi:hypothetical protein
MHMRPIHWLFVLSAAFFVGGIGFVVSAERTARQVPPAASSPAQRVAPAVATVKQIMDGIVAPSATSIWDSVSTTISAGGIDERMPRTDDEWAMVATSAAVLVESANLLLSDGRAVDTTDWPTMAHAMAESAGRMLKAAEARSTEAVLDVGDELNRTCDNCHERYSRN